MCARQNKRVAREALIATQILCRMRPDTDMLVSELHSAIITHKLTAAETRRIRQMITPKPRLPPMHWRELDDGWDD
jgi:hypothetical protein